MSSTARTRTQRDIDETIDKFATLFHPSTPRASPNTDSTPLPDDDEAPTARPRPIPQQHQQFRLSGSDSEFGSFVSVPPALDPLGGFDEEEEVVGGREERPRSFVDVEEGNPSLSFFDKVGQDAKKASEARGKDLVGELMKHEEDPREWLAEHSDRVRPSQEKSPTPPEASQKPLIPLPRESNVPQVQPPLPHSQFSLDDIDTSYFTPPLQTSPPQNQHTNPPPPPPLPHATSSPHLINLTPRATAPPVASTSTHVTASPSSPPSSERRASSASDDLRGARGSRPDSPHRSSSYQTLSSLSAKWMPSLFTVKASEEPKKRSLDSLFQPPQQPPKHTASIPIPVTQQRVGAGVEEVTHADSPFASHVFTPISGAPGFKPDGYDWDKGYSGDLEREVLTTNIQRKRGSDGMYAHHKQREDEERRVMERERERGKISEAIERRSGSVELVGRREGTEGVLSSSLATLIRPHLPALSRLPRSWTLLYSLDQHGISLNTLYSRCEAHLSNPKILSKGALIVVRDSGDAVFGAWVGEGVKMSRGKGYYGGGESFLWRVDEKKEGRGVKVWKWTGRNDYVALCENEFISFGGGDGHYGLYLDSSLYDGSSAACPTFANEPLCTPGPLKAGAVEFECVGLEVWGLGS